MAQLNIGSVLSSMNTLVNTSRLLLSASTANPTDLAGDLARAQELLLAARELDRASQALAKEDQSHLGAAEDRIEEVIKRLTTGVSTKKPEDMRLAVAAISDLFDSAKDKTIINVTGGGEVVEGGANDPPGTGEAGGKQKGDLRELFDSVSDSLLDAQTALNRKSLDYVANLDPTIPPAYYGIPSVKAELHVGFSEMKSSGINVILFNSQTQKNQFAESTVTFEIVGAPPPPGPTLFGEFVVPIPRLIVVGQKRDEVLGAVAKKLDAKKFERGRDDALVLRYEPPTRPPVTSPPSPADERPRYLVLYPGYPAGSTLAEWAHLAAARLIEREAQTEAERKQGKFVYEFDPTVFGTPQEVFTVTRKAAGNLGDATVNAMLFVGSWVAAMRVKKQP